MKLLVIVVLIGILLLINEWWWRRHKAHGELSRKFIHITVGSLLAFTPYFLSWAQIILLSALFIVVVLVSRRRRIFQGIHSVNRTTWGELFFALAIGILALLMVHEDTIGRDMVNSHTLDRAIFACAILHMSLADGLAAVVGVTWGLKTKWHYRVFGAAKSLAGTTTFFVVSFGLLVGFAASQQLLPGWTDALYLAGLAVAAAVIENLGVFGFDNLLVPLVIAVALSM